MRVPNAERAFIDIAKLQSYARDPNHRVGRHKARLFPAMLGMRMADAESLRQILADSVQRNEAAPGQLDEHGQRYQVDFVLTWRGRQADVRSVWIIRSGEDFPRLVTCYPLKDESQ